MKIVFFGTPTFAVPFLLELIQDSDIEVQAVVSQPDKPSGRGGKIRPTPVKLAAQEHNVPVYQPQSLKNNAEDIEKVLKTHEADVFVVLAYGKLIPHSILEIPRLGCANVHPSLLPKYRGPAPMQAAILSGDTETGVSIMILDEGMDTGPVLAQQIISLDPRETYPALQSKVHEVGPPLLIETLKSYYRGEIKPIAQNDASATVTSLLSREDGYINWSVSADEIDRMFRAYLPWPGVWTTWMRNEKKLRVKLLDLKPSNESTTGKPGDVSVQNGRLIVCAGKGSIEICKLQLEGKPPMNSVEILKGYPDLKSAHFGV